MNKRSKTDKKLDVISNKTRKLSLDPGKIFIGAHVSISNGLHNAFSNAESIGAKSFALFLRNQRQWTVKPLSTDSIEKFKLESINNKISLDQIVPHGSYLLNCGSPKEDNLLKSRDLLIAELQTCDKLGIKYYNIHPGSTCGLACRESTIKLISESINLAVKQSENVTVLVENMSGQGNTIGGDFQELNSILCQIENKNRIGVCLDTCHAFAAGFPLNTPSGYSKMMEDFESIIGLKFLKAVHINDSKSDCGSHLDRHEDIGKGKIGMDFFEQIVNDPRMMNIPLILETPGVDSYEKQIKLLYSLIKKS